MGARAYRILEQHSNVAQDECVVEVGSERGEGSTIWLAEHCAGHRITFYTVDIDPAIYKIAQKLVDKFETCSAHLGSGEDFLAVLDKKIRFAYLDGFDCIPEGLERADFIKYHRKRYRELGLRMTNRESARSHLAQARLVDENAASCCAVLIDDTFHRKGKWIGKGSLAMPYLEKRGFALSDLGGAGLATRCA